MEDLFLNLTYNDVIMKIVNKKKIINSIKLLSKFLLIFLLLFSIKFGLNIGYIKYINIVI